MTVKLEELDARLNRAIEANRRAFSKLDATFGLQISGEGGGEWFINCADEPGCVRGSRQKADCTIHTTVKDLEALQDGVDINGLARLIESGKVKVSGDPKLAARLGELLRLR